MNPRGPRPIAELLQGGGLNRLRTEAEERRELAARVRAALPAAEAAHVTSARVDGDGYLIVGMDSAAWAARLRYARETLLDLPLKVRVASPGEVSG